MDTRSGELHVASDADVQVSSLPGIAGDYRQYYAANARCDRAHGSPAPVTPWAQALQVMAMLEGGMQSASERREITCNPIAE